MTLAVAATAALDERMSGLVSREDIPIPACPEVPLRVQDMISGDGCELHELADVVSADQTCTAAVMRVANSAELRRRRPAESLEQAVARLGATRVARLLFVEVLGGQACRPGALSALRRHVWRRSTMAGELSRHLAVVRGLQPDVAFTCGLLHDFGKVVALSCLEDIIAHADGPVRISARRCAEVAERYQVELGAAVAARWQLPEPLTEAMSSQPDEVRSGSYAEIVAVAAEVVDVFERHPFMHRDHLADVVSDSELAEMVDVCRRLPSVVQALEVESRANASDEGVVIGESSLDEHRLEVEMELACRVRSGEIPGRSVALAGEGLILCTSETLVEGQVVELVIGADHVWAIVHRVVSEAGEWRAEARLVGLDPGGADAWRHLAGT